MSPSCVVVATIAIGWDDELAPADAADSESWSEPPQPETATAKAAAMRAGRTGTVTTSSRRTGLTLSRSNLVFHRVDERRHCEHAAAEHGDRRPGRRVGLDREPDPGDALSRGQRDG